MSVFNGMNNHVVYHVDYRSPPSGWGSISFDGVGLELIQDEGCCPEVRKGVYRKIHILQHDREEDFVGAYEEFFDLLRKRGVEFVSDVELECDLGSESGPFPLEDWIDRIKGMM